MTQEAALAILQTGANVFLTGEPGSGKTHTVNRYVAWLRAHRVEPAITASTGIAATHIGGFTIHSWSGIGVKRFLSDWDLEELSQNKRILEHMQGASVLIIDEVSMLSAQTLTMVEAACRAVRRNERPFGGLQVVLVGDFFQLPPVIKRAPHDESLFADEDGPRFAFESPAWRRANPLVCYLEEQHRQEDEEFLAVLGALRRGTLTSEHRARLRARRGALPSHELTQLYTHNEDVDRINDQALSKLRGTSIAYDMTSTGPKQLVEALKRGCLSPERLVLKVGARVMFTKNDVQTRQWVNGTLGEVVSFAQGSGYPTVRTRDGRTLTVEPEEWHLEDGGKVLARINQLPLRLAWAITVHKSQGMSLDAAHMDLSGAFEYGQGYVALSRVRTLAGLSLGGLNERALEVHPAIVEKDEEFRALSERAAEIFAQMSPHELRAMHERFLAASGGAAAKATTTPKRLA